MIPLLDEGTRSEHKRQNALHSLLLIGGIGAVLALATWLIWGAAGAATSILTLLFIYAFGPRVPPETVMRLYRAQRVDPRQGGQLSAILDVLAERAGLSSRPALYVVPSLTLNAFAAGTPNHSAIAVTEGLLRRMTWREVAGVLGHEVSHIRNNDLWVMGLADVVTRFVQGLSYFALALAILNVLGSFTGEEPMSWWAILLLYLAPTISSLLQLALSRTREFDADLEAAQLTGDPLGLASALRRLETYTGRFWEDLMFPVPGRRVPQPSMLRTHPPTEARIRRLLALEAPTMTPLAIEEEPMVSLVGWGPIEMRPRYRWPGLWY